MLGGVRGRPRPTSRDPSWNLLEKILNQLPEVNWRMGWERTGFATSGSLKTESALQKNFKELSKTINYSPIAQKQWLCLKRRRSYSKWWRDSPRSEAPDSQPKLERSFRQTQQISLQERVTVQAGGDSNTGNFVSRAQGMPKGIAETLFWLYLVFLPPALLLWWMD